MTRDAAGELGIVEPAWDENAADDVQAPFEPKSALEHVATLTEEITAVSRKAGLLEAEGIVLARANAMPTYKLSETKALMNAAREIRALAAQL